MASHKTHLSSVKENTFTVRRTDPILVVPAEPTPYEFKRLSDIDDQDGLRFYAPGIHLYKGESSKEGQNPATVIRDALARALVYYYPIAGRLREEAGRKLVVECNSEGVVFVEAEADVRVEDFGEAPTLPIPGAQQLLYGPENSGHEIIDQPLVYIQVSNDIYTSSYGRLIWMMNAKTIIFFYVSPFNFFSLSLLFSISGSKMHQTAQN